MDNSQAGIKSDLLAVDWQFHSLTERVKTEGKADYIALLPSVE